MKCVPLFYKIFINTNIQRTYLSYFSMATYPSLITQTHINYPVQEKESFSQTRIIINDDLTRLKDLLNKGSYWQF